MAVRFGLTIAAQFVRDHFTFDIPFRISPSGFWRSDQRLCHNPPPCRIPKTHPPDAITGGQSYNPKNFSEARVLNNLTRYNMYLDTAEELEPMPEVGMKKKISSLIFHAGSRSFFQ